MYLYSTIKVVALLSVVSLTFSSAEAAKMQQTFSYDAAGRLTSVMSDSDAFAVSLNESYKFDASGNIIEKVVDGQTVRMTYDAANQLMSRTDAKGTIHFVYDRAGRLIAERQEGQTIAAYEYGYLDKVTQVTRGSEVTKFHYNARGMLVAKERDGQIVETFGWDGIGLLAKDETVYANESHISGGVPLAAVDAGSDEVELKYYDSDYLGTTTAVYSVDGDVEAKLVSSYGAGSESGELRFTGKPYDADLDAHVFPYRNYRADAGRWASADPAGFPDGPNQHYYASVPTMGLDPMGLYVTGDTQWITGTYTLTHTWTEQEDFSLNTSFSVSFPWGASVTVTPGSSWGVVGSIYSTPGGTQPGEASPPQGWSWVDESVVDDGSFQDGSPSYSAEYQYQISPTGSGQGGSQPTYRTRRDGTLSGTYNWRRQAVEL